MEESPETKYEKWWINYYDFLGIDTSKYPKNKEELIKKCRILGIKEDADYCDLAEEYSLPTMPQDLYTNFTNIYNELTGSKRRN